MTTEKQLIEKMYYETFLKGDPNLAPIQVLGEAYMEEQKKDIPDLSAIRFAQGEIYFHHKDYEAAIFKWENIQNEWEPWAKKNMADAYFELGLLPTAEEIYKAIDTEDRILQTEVALQLFSLYIKQKNSDSASLVIKETVAQNPDYENVTVLARSFFEEHQDWASAIDLAWDEAIRLESLEWYDVMIGYAQKGVTQMKEPVFFEEGLYILATVNSERFEKLASALWNNFKKSEAHLSWVVVMDRVISRITPENIGSWSILSSLYEESYLRLINGTHLIREVGATIPNLLTNWMKICVSGHALKAATAVISWNEMFPRTLEPPIVYEAENQLLELEKQTSGYEEAVRLSNEVLHWATKQDLHVTKSLTWIMNAIKNQESYKLLVVGTDESGKSTVINSMVGYDILPEDNKALVLLDYHEVPGIKEIADSEIIEVEQIEEQPSFRYQRSYHAKLKSPFMQKHEIALMDTPSINDSDEVLSCLHAADGVLFVLNANNPFTEREQETLKQLREEMPNIDIHFLLNKMDAVYDERDKTIVETKTRVKSSMPNAGVFAFSPHYDDNSQASDFGKFFATHYKQKSLIAGRTTNLLYFVRRLIMYLLNKRIEKENSLVDSIKWNEEMVSKLNGAIHQIGDKELEKVRVISKGYQSIKDKMKTELVEKIPQILRGSSEYIKENSDFGKLHLELNEEMNKRVEHYLVENALPTYYQYIQSWIQDSTAEFNEVQLSMNEMCESFNALYDEEKLQLDCDFKVLDDWNRDADRLTTGIHWEKMNILLRFTPSQFLLKSAGKLLGSLSQNKSMLYNKYKQYVETEDYHEAATLIANKFLQPFELFERSIERDIKMFFRNPLAVLNQTVEESRIEIAVNKEALSKMRENPEWYQDPLTFFELKLRQNEWLDQKESKIPV
ncbi:GTP-binding protein [Bacillus tuaregi]|uniref:GTP-binding protein n=1 Tax=Bacillus tuaregi TaxID=1816695 RepID=UPI0008F88222|nr:GTP-binding protein [Bacillus tuaregi]